MNTEIASILGMRLEGSVGEPWDFVSQAGEGRFIGRVTGFSIESDKDWIAFSVSPFEFRGVAISNLIGVQRYFEPDGFIAAFRAGTSVGTNMFFNTDGSTITFDNNLASGTIGDKLSFLVGSIRFVR
jgi:hypothetical protein